MFQRILLLSFVSISEFNPLQESCFIPLDSYFQHKSGIASNPPEQCIKQFFASPVHGHPGKDPDSLSGKGIFCMSWWVESKYCSSRSKNKVLFHSKDVGYFQKGKKQGKMFSLWIPKNHCKKNLCLLCRDFWHHWYQWCRPKLKITLFNIICSPSQSLQYLLYNLD